MAPPNERLIGPREFSLILISLGLFSLGVAVWQSRQNVLKLREYEPETPGSLANLHAGLIAILWLSGIDLSDSSILIDVRKIRRCDS